jgi:hypothetical protein
VGGIMEFAGLALGVIPERLTDAQEVKAKKALRCAEIKRLQKIKKQKQKRKKGRK